MMCCLKRYSSADARARNAAYRRCRSESKPMTAAAVSKPDLNLPARPRILVITLRRLGDVLLTTPLIRSIRRGFKQSILDVLVFRGSDAILRGNPDIDHVITVAERPSIAETLALVWDLFRRYDLAVCTQAGDRPTLFALLAGHCRAGLVPRPG